MSQSERDLHWKFHLLRPPLHSSKSIRSFLGKKACGEAKGAGGDDGQKGDFVPELGSGMGTRIGVLLLGRGKNANVAS